MCPEFITNVYNQQPIKPTDARVKECFLDSGNFYLQFANFNKLLVF